MASPLRGSCLATRRADSVELFAAASHDGEDLDRANDRLAAITLNRHFDQFPVRRDTHGPMLRSDTVRKQRRLSRNIAVGAPSLRTGRVLAAPRSGVGTRALSFWHLKERREETALAHAPLWKIVAQAHPVGTP